MALPIIGLCISGVANAWTINTLAPRRISPNLESMSRRSAVAQIPTFLGVLVLTSTPSVAAPSNLIEFRVASILLASPHARPSRIVLLIRILWGCLSSVFQRVGTLFDPLSTAIYPTVKERDDEEPEFFLRGTFRTGFKQLS